MKKVVVLQRIVPHYRIPFFVRLRDALIAKGISFELIYGQESINTVPKSVDVGFYWAHRVRNLYFKSINSHIVFQPCLKHVKDADLIIFEQANRLLVNYLLLARILGRQSLLAYWGHGRNMQAKGGATVSEFLKKKLINQVDWWFAYTSLSADYVASSGFQREKITVVQNSIDTASFSRECRDVDDEEIISMRKKYRIEMGSNVCLYCGGLYSQKKLDFLIKASLEICKQVPMFKLFIIGDGPERLKIERSAQKYEWMHYVGPLYGAERAVFFRMAKAFLMPGLVGLAIIDCFVSQTPLFTTENEIHSPEIAYLNNGINGLMSNYSISSYVDAVVRYLNDETLLRKLQKGCTESAKIYTIDNMVSNFANGIVKCLAQR